MKKNLLFLILDPYFIQGLKSPVSPLRSGKSQKLSNKRFLAHCFRSYFTKAIVAKNVINDTTKLKLYYFFFLSE